MCIFKSTTSFRRSLKHLLLKPKNGYKTIISDICKDFRNKTIEEIRANRDLILHLDRSKVIKLRLQNSGSSLGKNDGFRLYYIVYQDKDEVTFLYVYPKRGPLQIISLDDSALINLLTEYSDEFKSDTLKSHDINDNLREISLLQCTNPEIIESQIILPDNILESEQ